MHKPEDFKYREMIVQNLDNSILVEAGAGSGKTSSLVDRMLALISTGRCTVDRMAAVTFTRKAAAELKGRFQNALEEALLTEKDKEKQKRYHDSLTKLEHLFSGTIHSFCARLLRERPIEARLDPDFEEMDETESLMLRDQCWTEYLERLYADEEPIFKQVVDLGIDPSQLIGTYQNMAMFPEVEAVRKKLKCADLGNEKKILKEYLDRSWNVMPRSVPEKGWDNLQTILRQAWLRSRYLNPDRDQDFIKILSGFNKSGGVTLNRWPTKEIAKEQKEVFETFKEDVVIPCLNRWRQYCHYFVMEIVAPAVVYFKEVRGKNSLMDFQDLLLKAAELLRDNSEVRRYFQGRFTHILVDEFQDTDPIQAEVILYLTGKDPEEKAWHKIKMKPGSLFIVGDPKQSIYRFRRADIDIYNGMKRIIKGSGGLVIPLTTNFRSFPAVCDWINPIFRSKFPEKATQYQPAFERLAPYKKLEGSGVKKITIDKVTRNIQKEIAARDAQRIASWIDWALRGNFKVLRTEEDKNEGLSEMAGPGDFMILLRYKAHLSIYASALEQQGIPYEISGGGAFNESEEIKHLLNLLAAVSEPEDQVALVSVLRGPFFGVSDDLLYRFRKGGGVFSYLAPLDECDDQEVKEQIGKVFSEIQQYHRWARTKPPAAALGMIIDRLGIIPLALTRDMAETRTGNLLKTYELSLWESANAQTSFPDMVDRLFEYYTEFDVEGMSIEPGKKDVVRLMNIHKAKGLEATVVFLADPLKDSSHPPDCYISRFEEQAAGFFLASCPVGNYGKEIVGIPPDWEKYEALESEYQKAEEERLLYVATTRARQLLVVSWYPEKRDKGGWKDLYPYLNQVEELDIPDVSTSALAESSILREEFEAGEKQIAENISKSKLHSYVTESVTEAAKADGENVPFSQDSGQGMSWGRMIHKMLEAAAKDDKVDLELMAENLLKVEERTLTEKESIVATVKSVMSSDLWKRMKKSEIALVEVPFSHKVDNGGLPKIVSGVIDLIFKEPEGWVIADYKTDKVNGNLDGYVNYYRPQVEMYSKYWIEMTGEKVKETGLYFVDPGIWITV